MCISRELLLLNQDFESKSAARIPYFTISVSPSFLITIFQFFFGRTEVLSFSETFLAVVSRIDGELLKLQRAFSNHLVTCTIEELEIRNQK